VTFEYDLDKIDKTFSQPNIQVETHFVLALLLGHTHTPKQLLYLDQ